MRNSNSRLKLALALALTGASVGGYAVQASAQSLPPAPPNEPGCYRFTRLATAGCDWPYISRPAPRNYRHRRARS